MKTFLETTSIKPHEMHVVPVDHNGETKYKVKAIGSKFKHGIKVGETLNDTHLDDFEEMGGKIKHVNESVVGGALSAVRGALKTDKNKQDKQDKKSSKAARHYDSMKEETTIDEAKRGRPRKNPLPVKHSEDDEYGPDVGPEADKNIHNQLKKAVDAHDMKGGAHVEFEDGKKHFVKSQHASKVLDAMNKLKPADRAKVQDHLYKSHDNFMSVHNLLK